MKVRWLARDCVEALSEVPDLDLLATDPPYAFGGSGDEHAISATVAIALREYARKLKRDRWAVIMCASSWRSTSYMVEAVRGVLEPVRVGHWSKPEARTKVATPGWKWASVHAVLLKKGSPKVGAETILLDHVLAEPVRNGRRAELPASVAEWAVAPFAVPGGVMCDPFAGSGALCRAAAAVGMEAWAVEKSPVPAAAADLFA